MIRSIMFLLCRIQNIMSQGILTVQYDMVFIAITRAIAFHL